MVFQREEPGQYKAGVLALLVHAVFLLLLIFGVSWQNHQPAGVEVELWEALPGPVPKQASPRHESKPEPKPERKPEPRPEPKAAKPEAKPEVKPDKADIELKAREEKRRKEEEQKKRKEEEQKEKDRIREQEKKERKAEQEKAEKAAQERAEAARKAQAEQAATQQAARRQAVEGYAGRIVAKIRPRIIDQPCLPLGDPEVRFSVTLMPTGELLFDPKLVKSSGASACDQAIERAIMLAQPFPKPDPALGIRDLNLIFWPNRKE